MKRIVIYSIFSVLLTSQLFGQALQEDIYSHNIIFKDAYAFKNYDEAFDEFNWLLENDPDIGELTIIKGINVLEVKMKDTKDRLVLEELQTKALSLYQYRFEHFGQTAKVKNFELTKTYKYWAARPDKHNEVIALFEQSLSTIPNKISNANLLAYMDILRRARNTGMKISDHQIIKNYDLLSDIIVSRQSVSEDSDIYLDKLKSIFTGIIKFSCEELESRYGKDLKDDFDAVDDARLYVKLAIESKCRDSDLFSQALSYVVKYDPSLNLLLYSAKLSLAQGKLEEAESYFGKALTFDIDVESKSEVYMSLAKIYTLKEEKRSAMNFAAKAIKVNGNKKAHSLIGSLYMSSFSECAEGKDIVQRRAVFIAAYDQFELANDRDGMEQAKANFPSAEEIHSNLYRVGQKIEVDCWFKENVELRKR
ncbi:MAG: hypothetical protein JXQ96_05560 [Cyclobacteriaceae bacterium]